jgi:hypothetical protein
MNILEQCNLRTNCAICNANMVPYIFSYTNKYHTSIHPDHILIRWTNSKSRNSKENDFFLFDDGSTLGIAPLENNNHIHLFITCPKCSVYQKPKKDYPIHRVSKSLLSSLDKNICAYIISVFYETYSKTISSSITAETVKFVNDNSFYHINICYATNKTEIAKGNLKEPSEKIFSISLNTVVDINQEYNSNDIFNKIELYTMLS